MSQILFTCAETETPLQSVHLELARNGQTANIRLYRNVGAIEVDKGVLRIQRERTIRSSVDNTLGDLVDSSNLPAGSHDGTRLVEGSTGEGFTEVDGVAVGRNGDGNAGAIDIVAESEGDAGNGSSLAAKGRRGRSEGGEEADEDGGGLHFGGWGWVGVVGGRLDGDNKLSG